MNLPIYLDHAATTPVAPEVLADMLPFFSGDFANPSAIHGMGAAARQAVDESREIIADAIGARPEEVYFTSGGTESDNWVVNGVARAADKGKNHILTTPIEHSALMHPCESLARLGFDVEFLPVDCEGRIEPEAVRDLFRETTALVSVMHGNNEVGTIEPIEQIGTICREKGVPLHTDAVQTFGKLAMNVTELNVDLMSLSAHKLHGPKGIGALYIRRGTKILPFMQGGEQEKGKRAGTQNVPGVVGFGSAVRRAEAMRAESSIRLSALRDRLIDGIESRIPGAMLCGPRFERLPNNAHFCFEGIEGESLLLALDLAGICASAGSACTAGSTEPSHVLLAMGLPVGTARGALRLTLGESNDEEAIDYTVESLQEIVCNLRELSGWMQKHSKTIIDNRNVPAYNRI